MGDIIINLQKSGSWKIQLTIAISFISSKDIDDERGVHLKSNNTDFITYDDANEVIDQLFELLLSRYKIGLETSMRGSDFMFDSVILLHYICHKISFKRGSHIWILLIEYKKATINLKNKDDKWFQHAVTVALRYREIT